MKTKVLKVSLALSVILVSVFVAWMTQEDDYAMNMENDIFTVENALALGESQPNLKFIASHKVYKVTQEKICDVYDEKDKNKCIGMLVKYHLIVGWWQTCDNTSDPKYKNNCRNGICTSEVCAKANGYQTQQPTGIQFDTPVMVYIQ